MKVASAGTIAADRPDPTVVAAMAEADIDISAARSKLVDPDVMAGADRIITMGCDVEGVPRIEDDWGLTDPKGQPIERVREIRDMVCRKAGDLAKAAHEKVAAASNGRLTELPKSDGIGRDSTEDRK